MIFTFQRFVTEDWHLYEEFCKDHPHYPLLFFMRKQVSDELKEAGIGFSIEKIRECNLRDPGLHSFEFVIDVQSVTHNDGVSCNFGPEDEQTLTALLQSHAYDRCGMAGFFHIGDYSFEEKRRFDVVGGQRVYVLYLNHIEFLKCEQVEPVAWSDDRMDLEELLQRERVEPYQEIDAVNGKTFTKNFCKDGPLEMYNPPSHKNHGVKDMSHILPPHANELLKKYW